MNVLDRYIVRSIIGSVFGAIFLIAAGEALRPLGTLSTFVVSLLALVVIMVAPGGLLGVLMRDRAKGGRA